MVRVVLALVGIALAGCSDRSKPPPPGDAAAVTRVFEKPRKGVRAVPPHAIRTDGVGPYLLGTPLKQLLSLTGRGPRVQLMELDRVVDYSLVWAESQKIVMGVARERGLAFISIVDREIARTEKGAGVGVTTEVLADAVGAPETGGDRLRDPRIRVFASLPNVRFVVERDRVIAVTVALEDRPVAATSPAPGEPAAAAPAAPPAPRCGAAPEVSDDALREAARAGADAHFMIGCAGSEPLVVVNDGGRITALTGSLERPRRIRVTQADDVVYAGPLETGTDGVDEVVVVSQSRNERELSARVELHRLEGGKYVRVLGREVYRVLAVSVPWIGSELDDVDLLLDMRVADETVHVGGLLLQRKGTRVVNSAPLASVKLLVRPRRPGEPDDDEVDGGVPVPTPVDAGVATTPPTRKKPKKIP